MNKNFLVSAVLLASSVGTLTASEVAASHSQALDTIQAKKKLTFIADATVTTREGTFRPHLSLIPAATGDYEFVQDEPGEALGKTPGLDPGLEYQVVVQLVNIETGKTSQTDAKYFAKIGENGKLKAYFCDTTSVCSEDRGTSEIALAGDVLTVTDAGFFNNNLTGDLHFISLGK